MFSSLLGIYQGCRSKEVKPNMTALKVAVALDVVSVVALAILAGVGHSFGVEVRNALIAASVVGGLWTLARLKHLTNHAGLTKTFDEALKSLKSCQNVEEVRLRKIKNIVACSALLIAIALTVAGVMPSALSVGVRGAFEGAGISLMAWTVSYFALAQLKERIARCAKNAPPSLAPSSLAPPVSEPVGLDSGRSTPSQKQEEGSHPSRSSPDYPTDSAPIDAFE